MRVNLTGKWDSSAKAFQAIETVGEIGSIAIMNNIEEISLHEVKQIRSDVVRTHDGHAWRSLIIETDDGDIELTLHMKRQHKG